MNSSPSTTSNLHRKMFDLLLHHAHDMQHVFTTFPRYHKYSSTTPSTDLVVYQQPHSRYNNHEYEFQQQFLSVITLAALFEYIQDPDPPEIRELEQQEQVYQLELENDSLYVAMEDAQWELERVQRNYLTMKQRFYYNISNDDYQHTQDELLLLNLGQRYSDLQLEYASLKSDLEDYQIMNQEQLRNRDEMVKSVLQQQDVLQTKHSLQTTKLNKLQTQLDTYQVALASKDLKLFQLVEERDSLKQQVKLKDYQGAKLEQQVLLLSLSNDTTHSKASTSTTSTSTVAASTSTSSDNGGNGDDEASSDDGDNGADEESTEHSPTIKTTITTPSLNRWVQGLNRLRPPRTRRSSKVQPLTKEIIMEH
jgi:hypothetical protein